MKKINLLFTALFIFCLFSISNVSAEPVSGNSSFAEGGGSSGSMGSCSGFDWCFGGTAGLRFSLYKWNGTNWVYYGSVDRATSTSLNGRSAKLTKNGYGKVAYQSGLELKWDSQYYKLNFKSGEFSKYYGSGKITIENLKEQIKSKFKFDTKNATSIKTAINDFFNTSFGVDDLSLLYLTVEPTAFIYNKSGASYYGTVYELLNIPGVTDKGQALDGLIPVFYDVNSSAERAESLALRIIAGPLDNDLEDKNNFVTNDKLAKVWRINNYIGNLKSTGLYSSDPTNRKYNRDQIVSNKGYAIGVFWLASYTGDSDCKSSCGSNNISCAADWCESKSTTSAQKEACVLACGVNKVNPSSCGTTSTPSASTSKCSVSKDSNKQTCVYDSNNYYKEECLESTTVKYSNDLPVTLTKQTGGFNYSAKTSGVRACVLTFDTAYYNYKYYVTKNSERNAITQKKTNFENKGKNDNYNYKFEATDGITLYVDGKSYKLVQTENKTSEVTFQNRRYGLEKVYTTTNESLFELPQQCYSYKNGKASLKAGCSDIKSYSKYYGFYSTNSAFEVPTKTISLKSASGLNDTNKCQYYNIEQIEQDVNCYTVLNGSYSASGSYSGYIDYYIVNRGNATVTNCKLNGSNITCEDSTTDANKNNLYVNVASNQIKDIDASVTYWYNGQKITKSCPIKISGKPKTVVNKSCPVENPNPTAYDAIRKYCNESWKTDINGYTSYNDCYNRCSNRKNTCKTTVKCNDDDDVKKYCENSTNLSNDGYKSIEMCINDCSCKDTGGLEYLYRPIAVGGAPGEYNAFPNRKAGTNWYGYENLTLDDKFDEDPIYTIELNQETIRTLKNETSGNISKYVDYDGDSDNGYYKSDLIDKYEGTIFTCKGGC